MKLSYDKRGASIIALSLILTISFGSVFVKAQPPPGTVVGVEVGDWVRYGNIEVTWDSTLVEPEPELIELNNTIWFEHRVTEILIDTVIVFERTTKFKNDSESRAVFHLDIYNGDGNDTLMFVSSELNTNDPVYQGAQILFWVNETIQRIHAGVIREVNHVFLRDVQPTEEQPAALLDLSVDYFWDRATGVLAARTGAGIYLDQSGNTLATWSMAEEVVDTNLWSPPEPDDDDEAGEPPYTIIVLVAIVLIIIVMAWRMWPRKRKVKVRNPRSRS